jgi:exopolysaccharide biosynthesis protein
VIKKNKIKLTAVIVIIVSFIAFYAGHFLFFSPNRDNQPVPNAITSASPAEYRQFNTIINGNRQRINILEINLKNSGVTVKPALSFDSTYGFESLSAIVSRHKAYAAVNGGFFYEYGQPGGMVAVDGNIIRGSAGKYPVFIVRDGNAMFMELKTTLYIKLSGRKVKIDDINSPGSGGKIIAYTPWYGSSNRAEAGNITAVVKNGIITRLVESDGETLIPDGGMLITFYKPFAEGFVVPAAEGEKAELVYEPNLGDGFQAYECGSWLVRDGRNVAPDRDPWVGVLTNRDPRTVVGLKDGTTVVLMTVDGRQPGYSTGLTAGELSDFLLDYGVRDAAMLDGGASTEMIVKGKIVNRPSFKGKERPLGGALIVKYKE